MSVEDDLLAAGLSKSESKVYLYLLEHSPASPPQIAKGTGILRTNCYHLLETLKEKGLLREEQKGSGRKLYFTNDPSALLRSMQDKAAALERALPDIRARFVTKANKPAIRFYDGLDELKNIYRASLEADEVFALGSLARLKELMPEFLQEYFSDLRKHHVVIHDVLSARSKTEAQRMAAIMNSYVPSFLSEKYGDTPTDILVWDDSVALITLEEPFFGTVLTNPALANTFKMIIRVLQDSARQSV